MTSTAPTVRGFLCLNDTIDLFHLNTALDTRKEQMPGLFAITANICYIHIIPRGRLPPENFEEIL